MSRRLQRVVVLAVIIVLVLGLVASLADANTSPIQFGRIQYDSPGSDNGTNASLNGEYFVVKNYTGTRRAMHGWTVRDAANHVYTFSSTFVIGANSDQNGIAPEVTLGSVVIDLRHAFLLVGQEVKSHTFKPRVVSLGVRENVVKLVLNPVLESRVPPTTRATIDSVQKRLFDGVLRFIDSTGAFVSQ